MNFLKTFFKLSLKQSKFNKNYFQLSTVNFFFYESVSYKNLIREIYHFLQRFVYLKLEIGFYFFKYFSNKDVLIACNLDDIVTIGKEKYAINPFIFYNFRSHLISLKKNFFNITKSLNLFYTNFILDKYYKYFIFINFFLYSVKWLFLASIVTIFYFYISIFYLQIDLTKQIVI